MKDRSFAPGAETLPGFVVGAYVSAAKPTWDAIDAAVESLADTFDRAGYPCDSEDVELIVPWRLAERLAAERGEQIAYDAEGRAFLGSFYGVEISTYRKSP